MITVRLHGGLGNQLFQYAAARALALRLGTEVQLDGRAAAAEEKTWLHPALHHFNVAVSEPNALPPLKSRPLAYALWRRFGRSPRFLREQGLGLNAPVLSAPDDTYLHGYFQTEKYFKDQAAQIRRDLEIITPPSAQNSDALDLVAKTPHATAVHLRRGDYVASAKAADTHGSVGQAYYTAALSKLAEELGATPQVFVFSNDPAWCEQSLDLPFPFKVFGHNGPDQHYEDLRLMAACEHHVIANSTFSWWGAWLGASPTQRVFAPSQWFAPNAPQNPDILPDHWHRV